jgi:LPXTG-motif cell wall-anchored protein
MLVFGTVGSSAHAQTNPETFDGNKKCSDLGMAGLKIDSGNLENTTYAGGDAHVEVTGDVPDGLEIQISGLVETEGEVRFGWSATLEGQPFLIDVVLTKVANGGFMWTYASGASSGTAWTDRDSISHVDFCFDTTGGTTTGGTTTGGTTTGGTTTGGTTTGGTTTGGPTTGGTTTGGPTTGGPTTGGDTGATTGATTGGTTGATTGGTTGATTGGTTTGGTVGATTGAATTGGPTEVEGEVITRPVAPTPAAQAPATQVQGRVVDRQLPRTGGNDWTLSALGALLVVGGAASFVLRNRLASRS